MGGEISIMGIMCVPLVVSNQLLDWTTGLTILPQKYIFRHPIQPLVCTIVRSCKAQVICSKLGKAKQTLFCGS